MLVAPMMVLATKGRLRQLIESHPIEITDGSGARQAIQITISVGVADLGTRVDSKEKLVQAADQALYRAKEEGRNRVVVTPDVNKPLPPK